ncbi:MarR family winged helix-turn-helix transcriptional regulator [Parvularcula sp. IMCC14364]|uniref:MarR family winged helix-turn-helix transcriptional regulator n=1 Tax=Parvularcula sp. IMCC14364 TaxID=3067902 RepID=UPI0027419D98|nr:MarR family transcriptional regulator [Parvularcula sp. IMCC14364]
MGIEKSDWMQAWVNLIHAGTYLRQGLERAFREELGISLSEQDLLKQLSVNDGVLMLSELGDRIYFSKAGITRMLDRLEKRGLVRRQEVPGNRRSLSAVLTPAGRKTFEQSREILSVYVEKSLYDKLDDEEIISLKNNLTSLLKAHGVFDGQQRHLKGEKQNKP